MRMNINLHLWVLLLLCACAGQQPSSTTLAAMRAEFAGGTAVVDTDCIFSAPVKNDFIAYRIMGLCLFSDKQLRLYYGGEKPALAFAWPLTSIKSYAFHGDTFSLVTDTGNFGLVLKDAPGLIAALRARGVPENNELPLFRAKDPSPFNWM